MNLYPYKLGKQPPRIDKRTLKLSKYLDLSQLVRPPAVLDWGQPDYGMLGNNQHGCCTCTAAAHCIQDWTAACGDKQVPTTEEVLAAYDVVSGGVDEGAFMLDVLNYWRRVGIGGHKILAYLEADITSIPELLIALHLFGGLYCGFALPVSAQQQRTWKVTDANFEGSAGAGTWGGHAVHLCSYDAGWFTCATWGARQEMTKQWFMSYCDEAWAILSMDWIGKAGLAPNGFNLAQLERDLKTVGELARNA